MGVDRRNHKPEGANRVVLTRMRSGVTPEASCSSSVSCWCVVDAGWITSVLASPVDIDHHLAARSEWTNSNCTACIRTDVSQVTR